VKEPPYSDAIKILDLLSSLEFFRDLSLHHARDLLQAAQEVAYKADEYVIRSGEYGNTLFIVISGVAKVTTDGSGNEIDRYYISGDFFGETALISQECIRVANIIAETDLSVLCIEREDFRNIFSDQSDVVKRLRNLAEIRKSRAYEVINNNTFLCELTPSQKTQLESILRSGKIKRNEKLWRTDEPAKNAFLVDQGQFRFIGSKEAEYPPFECGTFLGDVKAIQSDGLHGTTVEALEDSTYYTIERKDLLEFFEKNPGLLVSFHDLIFIE